MEKYLVKDRLETEILINGKRHQVVATADRVTIPSLSINVVYRDSKFFMEKNNEKLIPFSEWSYDQRDIFVFSLDALLLKQLTIHASHKKADSESQDAC